MMEELYKGEWVREIFHSLGVDDGTYLSFRTRLYLTIKDIHVTIKIEATHMIPCGKFHQVDTKTILITLNNQNNILCLSTFQLLVKSLYQD